DEAALPARVDVEEVREHLARPRHRIDEERPRGVPGVATGLAVTGAGGDVLLVEVARVDRGTEPLGGDGTAAPSGSTVGTLELTGQLGDVMQESVQAARSYVRSRAVQLGIRPTVFEKKDIHVHVPEGATPKDGPSAGVAMITSIVSALTGIPVRRDVAMTGEITLRGRVLPIGGLKEKRLAALRGGIGTVLIPQDNEKDLAELPDNVRRGLEILPVSTVDEVLARALVRRPEPINWVEPEEVDPVAGTPAGNDAGGVVTH
ncbi:MAG: hypothetical protein K8E66_09240, partial [Phycisphaerales bacterium]|nr:hypothetical protein [Phycisphaerales bacterium]